MKSYFVPYRGDRPASMLINGHELVFLARDKRTAQDGLAAIGADRIKKLRGGKSREEEEKVLSKYSRRIGAGIVIVPSDLNYEELVKSLESQLPWIH